MRKSHQILLLLVLGISCSKSSEIIYRKPGEIAGLERCKDWAGVLLNSNYAFDVFRDSVTNEFYVAYDSVMVEEGGKANYKLLALLKVGVVKEPLYIAYTSCEAEKLKGRRIVAVYEYEENAKYFNKISKAWYLNEEALAFIEISASEVRCFNEFLEMD